MVERALLTRRDVEQEVLDDNELWEVNPDVRSTYSTEGAVLLDVRGGLCYRLNMVATRIWVTIETSHAGIGIAGIADALETHFDVPRHKLESDIAEYLNELERIGVAKRRNSSLSRKTTAGGI